MITEKELLLSNDNAIKKDFYQIYPEILDIASKISKRWDPQSSNESDPGVVLLKLLAFIADKNNYNIDKNILECFMPSATQETSMRKLCEMMGYDMNYYNSATTTISFNYRGKDLEEAEKEDGEDHSFELEAFKTTLTNYDEDINYVLIDNVSISNKNVNYYGEAIEGTLAHCKVGDSEIIKISNLDDNNRFYLPETSIAENGIWIRNNGEENWKKWERKTNLNIQLSGKYVWKFGFDSSKELPYIEFPDDISQLIGDGLEIQYVRTSGANGNVSARTLTKLTSFKVIKDNHQKEITLIDADDNYLIDITNESASINGADKETLNSAYNNFKKTVGTFETLVTCRDYANYIYNMTVSENNKTPLVSNIQVADIRDDINGSNLITTYEEFGLVIKNNPVIEDGDQKLSHFDINIYPYTPITTSYNKDNYINSFKPYSSNNSEILYNLRDTKTISHNIRMPNPTDIYAIKNYYNLKAKITTTYKVNKVEEKEILNNIASALFKNFNLREIDFGEEIPFDNILNTIQTADTRIKNVALEEPTLSTKIMNTEGVESNLTLDNTHYKKLLAKNILAGRLNLFDYNENFEFDLGQKAAEFTGGESLSVSEQITSIETLFNLNVSNLPYTLKKNEIIQFIAPNLSSTLSYPYGVNYSFKSDNTIKANCDYKLTNNDFLLVNYTDSNDKEHYIVYKNTGEYPEYIDIVDGHPREAQKWSGIIKPNFELKDSKSISYNYLYNTQSIKTGRTWSKVISDNVLRNQILSAGFDLGISSNGYNLFGLEATQEIDLRDFVKDKLIKQTPCYWIIDGKPNNSKINWVRNIDTEGTFYTYILQDDDYFFYSSNDLSELVIFGSGTKLTTKDITLFENTDDTKLISLESIDINGLGAFTKDVWKYINFKNDDYHYLEIQEMQIITLSENNILEQLDASISSLNNNFEPINNASYLIGEEHSSLPGLSIDGIRWEARSRLDLNVGPDLTQKLTQNQSIMFKNISGTTIKSIEGDGETQEESTSNIRTNYLLQTAGSNNIDVSITDVDEYGELNVVNNFSVMEFEYDNPLIDDQITGVIDKNSYLKLNLNKINNYKFNISIPDNNFGLIMFYYQKLDESSYSVELNGTDLEFYNDDELSPWFLKEGINIIKIPTSQEIKLIVHRDSGEESNATLTISNISIIKGVVDFGVNEDELLATIKSLDPDNIFYYNHPLDNNILINQNILNEDGNINPLIWFDYNNICNKFVISELDASTSFKGIELVKSSRI